MSNIHERQKKHLKNSWKSVWSVKSVFQKFDNMQIQSLDKVIYQLTVEDLQNVANDELSRDLTEEEVRLLEDKIGDYIDWYEIISVAISNHIRK